MALGIANMNIGRQHRSLVSLHGKLYVIRGLALNNVKGYDPEK